MSSMQANTNNNKPLPLMVIGQKGVAARATASGCSHATDSTAIAASAVLAPPMAAAAASVTAGEQTRKFIVTLKPVSKLASTEERANPTTDHRPHCEKISIRINSEQALKGKTLLNAFRLLTHKNFFTVDENYQRSKSVLHSSSKKETRLLGGKEKGCQCMRMIEDQLKKGETPVLCDQQTCTPYELPTSSLPVKKPAVNTSSIGIQTSLSNFRTHGGSENRRKKQTGCFCCRRSSSSISISCYDDSKISMMPATALWTNPAAPPKPPRTYAQDLQSFDHEPLSPPNDNPSTTKQGNYRTVDEYLGPPRPRKPSTAPSITSQRQQGSTSSRRPRSPSMTSQPRRDSRAPSIASQQREPPPKPPRQPPRNDPSLNPTYSQLVLENQRLEELSRTYTTGQPAPTRRTQITQPKPSNARVSQNPTRYSTAPRPQKGGSQHGSHPTRKDAEDDIAIPLAYDDSRIVTMENQIDGLCKELSGIKRSFIPQEDLLRYGVLAQRLQELNGVLGEMKQNYAKRKAEPTATAKRAADREPLSTATSRSKSEQFECCAYYSNNDLSKRHSGGGVTTCTGSRGSGNINSHTQTYNNMCCKQPCCSEPCSKQPCCKHRQPSPAPTAATTKTDSYAQVNADQREQETQVAMANDDNGTLLKNESSFCLYCAGKDVPVLRSNLLDGILRYSGQHNPGEVALTVVLQRNDLYHINVSIMRTGQSLGCLLATEAAMWEAKRQHIFDNYITFFILDTRNTTKQKMMILSHSTFEVAQ